MKKRILSLLLTLVMVLGMLPVTAYAEKFTDPAIDFIDVTDPDNLGRAVTDGNGHYVDTFAYAAKQEGYIWLEKITLDSARAWSTEGNTDPTYTVDKVEGTRYVDKYWLSYENDGQNLGEYADEYVAINLLFIKLYDIKNQCYVEPTTSAWFTLDPDNDTLSGGDVVPVGMYAQEYCYDVWTDLYLEYFEPIWVGFPDGCENMTVTMDGQTLKPRSEAWTESLGSHTPGMYWVKIGDAGSSSATTYPCISPTLYVNSPVRYVYDVKPEIHSVSVNGTEMDVYDTAYVAADERVEVVSVADRVLSDALMEYGCTLTHEFDTLVNGTKIKTVHFPVANSDGTMTYTYSAKHNPGDKVAVVQRLIVNWPDGSKDIVDTHAVNIEVCDTVSDVTLNMDAPLGGQVASTPDIVISESDKVMISDDINGYWEYEYKEGEWLKMTNGQNFEEGKSYRYHLYLEVRPGYSFSDVVTINFNGTSERWGRMDSNPNVVGYVAEFTDIDYGARLEFYNQSPIVDDSKVNAGVGLCDMNIIPGEVTFRFNHAALSPEELSAGFNVIRNFFVYDTTSGSTELYSVTNDTKKSDLSYKLNAEAGKKYRVMEAISLSKDGEILRTLVTMYNVTVADATPDDFAFTVQPNGGVVAPGEKLTVSWATNYTPVSLTLAEFTKDGAPIGNPIDLPVDTTSIELGAHAYGYLLYAYYDNTDFITSTKFVITEKEVLPVYFYFDDTPVASQDVVAGECAKEPQEPYQDGYIFLGWYTADDELYDFSAPVTSELHLYAKFELAGGQKGDVNNDGAINQYDYILVKRHYFGTRYLTDDEMTRADVNSDGAVNQYDYILIKRHYFGTFVIG